MLLLLLVLRCRALLVQMLHRLRGELGLIRQMRRGRGYSMISMLLLRRNAELLPKVAPLSAVLLRMLRVLRIRVLRIRVLRLGQIDRHCCPILAGPSEAGQIRVQAQVQIQVQV
jgi:hypothetical protein